MKLGVVWISRILRILEYARAQQQGVSVRCETSIIMLVASCIAFCLCMHLSFALQYASFDAASASSTYSTDNLSGSPAFAAQQALSVGSGYWCSSGKGILDMLCFQSHVRAFFVGSQSAGQSVSWTGVLNARRKAVGIKIVIGCIEEFMGSC